MRNNKRLFENEFTKERALLIGVLETDADNGSSSLSALLFDRSMEELDALTSACEMEPVGILTQQLPRKNNAHYVGEGKLEEIKGRIQELNASIVIVNDTLSPTQIRNLHSELKTKVMDRTALILEIFRKRARTREAKLQVELASLQYMKPRLIGMWETQNRQGGTSGAMSSKGEGETQLELDRRQIDHRLAELRRELKKVGEERFTQRKKRSSSRTPLISLIGYTNAGKSAIMNAMLKRTKAESSETKNVFEENMLFATLDTSIRKIETGDNMDFMLSDTVGFVNKLPTSLVEAFRSTLEELKEADLLLHVIDYSDPDLREHIKVTDDMIAELGAGAIPVIYVFNKADVMEDDALYPRKGMSVRDSSGKLHDSIYMSAKDERSIDMLMQMIKETAFSDYVEVSVLIPYEKGSLTGKLQNDAQILETSYEDNGTRMRVRIHKADYALFKDYMYKA